MSITGNINMEQYDLNFPAVRILMFGYLEKILCPEVWYHPNRISPFWRFYWGTSTGAKLIFKENIVELKPDSVIFVPPNTPFETRADKPFSQFYIHFEWGGMTALQLKSIQLPIGKESQELVSVRNWYNASNETISLHVYAVLFHYLVKLQSYLPDQSSRIDLRIQKAVQLLGNEKNGYSLRETAKAVSMSYDHFRDTFKKELGVGPSEYRMMQRMNHARRLLLSNDLSIEEVASRTGFANRFHFSKTFKQFFKLPPVVYRKSHLNDPLNASGQNDI